MRYKNHRFGEFSSHFASWKEMVIFTKAAFFTLGCKVNQYETQAIKEAFCNDGFIIDEENPDVAVINTCSVTAESDRKSRQLLRRIRNKYPDAVIALTGCFVQAFPDEASALCEADVIVGNKDTANVVKLCKNVLSDRKRIIDVEPHLSGEPYNTLPISCFDERTRAYMKIEDGCDRFCTYCIIPYARGRVRSRSLDEIRAEAHRLSQNGYKEIVLVGINLSAYGYNTDYNLCDAVEAVCCVDGIKRVRLGSLEPDHISDEMLERFKAQEKFCPQFHLSLQSGCDRTLKRMNRHYTAEFYCDLVNRIRKIFADASVTTDIMVGFSGETDDEFNESLEFVKKIGFARSHIFTYSVRKGTVAAGIKQQNTRRTKEERACAMSKVTELSEKMFLQSQIGRVYNVLFEGKTADGYCFGYTPNYSKVAVLSENNLSGEILPVKIITCENDYCIGKIFLQYSEK